MSNIKSNNKKFIHALILFIGLSSPQINIAGITQEEETNDAPQTLQPLPMEKFENLFQGQLQLLLHTYKSPHSRPDTNPLQEFMENIFKNCPLVAFINKNFFTVITGFHPEDIDKKGFEHRPFYRPLQLYFNQTLIYNKQDSLLILQNNFSENKRTYNGPEQIPSYYLYRLIDAFVDIPQAYWQLFKSSNAQLVRFGLGLPDNLSPAQISRNKLNMRELAKNLQGSPFEIFMIWGQHIGDEEMRGTAQYFKSDKLRLVALCHNNMNDNAIISFAPCLQNNKTLRDLYIQNNNFGDEGALSLARNLENTLVSVFSLSNNHIGPRGAISLVEKLTHNTQVYHLTLSGNPMGDEGIIGLSPFIKDTQLEELWLENTNISNRGAIIYTRSLTNSKMQKICLSNNRITLSGAKGITQYLESPHVHTLNLERNKIGLTLNLTEKDLEEGMTIFSQSLQSKKVLNIYLGNNNLGPKGARGLNFKNTPVQLVSLISNNLGAEGAENFVMNLAETLVQYIFLDKNNIGDLGVTALSFQGTEVIGVCLAVNNISDSGAKIFAEKLPGSKVRTVNLAGNNISLETRLFLRTTYSNITWMF